MSEKEEGSRNRKAQPLPVQRDYSVTEEIVVSTTLLIRDQGLDQASRYEGILEQDIM